MFRLRPVEAYDLVRHLRTLLCGLRPRQEVRCMTFLNSLRLSTFLQAYATIQPTSLKPPG
jgi:hypothetical protein